MRAKAVCSRLRGKIIEAFRLDSLNPLEVSNEGWSNVFIVEGEIVRAFRLDSPNPLEVSNESWSSVFSIEMEQSKLVGLIRSLQSGLKQGGLG